MANYHEADAPEEDSVLRYALQPAVGRREAADRCEADCGYDEAKVGFATMSDSRTLSNPDLKAIYLLEFHLHCPKLLSAAGKDGM